MEDALEPYEPVALGDESEAESESTFSLSPATPARERHKVPIADLGVPSRSTTARILDVIAAAVLRDRVVYVHCWGGVRRTGVVAGCRLRRHGAGLEEALKILEERWGTVAKVGRMPQAPKTDEQAKFVRNWDERPQADRTFNFIERERSVRGALLGGVVGDALGAPVELLSLEAIRRKYGPSGITEFANGTWPIGSITDDTQLTLFTAEAILRYQSRLVAKRIASLENVAFYAYVRWLHTQGTSVGSRMNHAIEYPSCRRIMPRSTRSQHELTVRAARDISRAALADRRFAEEIWPHRSDWQRRRNHIKPGKRAMRSTHLIVLSPDLVVAEALGTVLRAQEPPLRHAIQAATARNATEAGRVLDAIPPEELRNALVVLAGVGDDRNPWEVGAQHHTMGAPVELLLTYPEISFLLFGYRSPLPETHSFANIQHLDQVIERAHEHDNGRREWFDPKGARQYLHNELHRVALEEVGHPCATSEPRGRSLVVDDEPTYAMLIGYAMYRAGYNTSVVSSKQTMKEIVAPTGDRRATKIEFVLSHYDFQLNFSDITGTEKDRHTLHRAWRDAVRAESAKSTCWTVAVMQAQQEIEEVKGHPSHTVEGKNSLTLSADALKPDERRWIPVPDRSAGPQASCPAIPEEETGRSTSSPLNERHPPSPYHRQVIAQSLLRRARALSGAVSSDVENELHAALLSLDAFHLLSSSARTTALLALELREIAEVRAEGALTGGSSVLRADLRLKYIDEDLKALGIASEGSTETGFGMADAQAKPPFMVRLAASLRSIYRNMEQFEAADDCARIGAKWELKIGGWKSLSFFCRSWRAARDFTMRHLPLASPPSVPAGTQQVETARSGSGLRTMFEVFCRCIDAVGRFIQHPVRHYLYFATRGGTSILQLAAVTGIGLLAFGGLYSAILPQLLNAPHEPFWKVLPIGLEYSGHTLAAMQPGLPEVWAKFTQPLSQPPFRHLLALRRPSPGTMLSVLTFSELGFAYFHLALLVSLVARRVQRSAG